MWGSRTKSRIELSGLQIACTILKSKRMSGFRDMSSPKGLKTHFSSTKSAYPRIAYIKGLSYLGDYERIMSVKLPKMELNMRKLLLSHYMHLL